jgi:hypothetical protein
MNDIALLAEDGDMVNITPTLLRFGLKFLLIFAVVAVVAVLTPRMARAIDSLRAKHEKPAAPEDPRCKAVRGPYDMPEPSGREPEEKPCVRAEADRADQP